MDVELRKLIREAISFAGPENYFAALIAHGFTWPEYVGKDTETWYSASIDFLVTGNASRLVDLEACGGHFGVDHLEEALRSWKVLHDLFAERFHRRMVGREIVEIQQEMVGRAGLLHQEGEIPGIGCWLLCAPFKMLLLEQEHLYGDEAIDDVLPPLGRAVMRGVRKLLKRRFSVTAGFGTRDFTSEEGGSIHEDGMGVTYMVHEIEKRIARIAGTRALPVNSGLWLYGQDELVL
jgi:hypothetical protein